MPEALGWFCWAGTQGSLVRRCSSPRLPWLLLLLTPKCAFTQGPQERGCCMHPWHTAIATRQSSADIQMSLGNTPNSEPGLLRWVLLCPRTVPGPCCALLQKRMAKMALRADESCQGAAVP